MGGYFDLSGRSALVTEIDRYAATAVAQRIRSRAAVPEAPRSTSPTGRPMSPQRTPMKRLAEPSEIAGAFAPMSDAASYVTGQVLPVDGAMVI